MKKTTSSKTKKGKPPEEEQRRWPRLKPSSVPFLKSVSFSQGTDVQVIDISRGGMLIETEVRLRPQMKIHLKLLTSDGLIKLDGSVLRSSISSLKGVPRYQSAIAFEHPFHMLDDLSEQPAEEPSRAHQEDGTVSMPAQDGNQQPPQPLVGEFDESSGILTFVAPDLSSMSLAEMFKRNDW